MKKNDCHSRYQEIVSLNINNVCAKKVFDINPPFKTRKMLEI